MEFEKLRLPDEETDRILEKGVYKLLKVSFQIFKVLPKVEVNEIADPLEAKRFRYIFEFRLTVY